MMSKQILYKMQREWRRHIIRRLKLQLGNYCHHCETPDTLQLGRDQDRPFLELVIPRRRDPDLSAYGNNTITIYSQILKGKIPKERVKLLCEDCKFELGLEK